VTFVLDASVTLAWFHKDERTPATDELLDRAPTSSIWVPSHWPIEVANAFQQGVRRKRITIAHRDAALATLALLPVAVDPETGIHAWSATLDLSTRFTLTVYDATYLELALRRGLPLATLDRELRAAASAAGVPLLGL
jgi:predicted nucleic acid-binding protein